MDRRTVRKYIRQNPQLENWFRQNRDWVNANPHLVSQMFNQLSTQNMYAANPNGKRQKRKMPFSGIRKLIPKVKWSAVSNATRQLSSTLDMVDNIKTIMSVMRP